MHGLWRAVGRWTLLTTAMLGLLTALTYPWQIKESGRIASAEHMRITSFPKTRSLSSIAMLSSPLECWKASSFLGSRPDPRGDWWPRRTYWEYLKLMTGQDLPNDPEVWEAWLKAHPNLIWDKALNRFVDDPREAAPRPATPPARD